MNLHEIIIRAIPSETCTVKNALAMHRRKVLEQRLNDYIADQLANQFNAKPVSDQFKLRVGEEAN